MNKKIIYLTVTLIIRDLYGPFELVINNLKTAKMYHDGIHTPCPCVFRDIELKFCIFPAFKDPPRFCGKIF